MYDKWISGTTYYYKITPTDRSGNSANKARNISTQKPSTGSICKNSAGTLTVTFNSHIYPSKIPKIESFDPAILSSTYAFGCYASDVFHQSSEVWCKYGESGFLKLNEY